MDTHATIEELLEAVFSTLFVPRLHSEHERGKLVEEVTNTDDRPDLSSEGEPYTDKTVNVKQ
jgi:hypothetical protein